VATPRHGCSSATATSLPPLLVRPSLASRRPREYHPTVHETGGGTPQATRLDNQPMHHAPSAPGPRSSVNAPVATALCMLASRAIRQSRRVALRPRSSDNPAFR